MSAEHPDPFEGNPEGAEMWRRLSELRPGQHVYCRSVADNFVRRTPVDTGWLRGKLIEQSLVGDNVGRSDRRGPQDARRGGDPVGLKTHFHFQSPFGGPFWQNLDRMKREDEARRREQMELQRRDDRWEWLALSVATAAVLAWALLQ